MKYRRLPCPVCQREVCHLRRHLRRHPGAVPVAFPADEDPTGERWHKLACAVLESIADDALYGNVRARRLLFEPGGDWLMALVGVDAGYVRKRLIDKWINRAVRRLATK